MGVEVPCSLYFMKTIFTEEIDCYWMSADSKIRRWEWGTERICDGKLDWDTGMLILS
jgi:hypothetical protein